MRIAAPLLLPALCLPLALAACADKPPRTAQTMIPAGEPVGCLQIGQIRSTRVIDDQTIDFTMRNGSVMRSTLPNRCPGLGFERAFSYRTSIPQLCNVDIITVVVQGGGPQIGASCGLGMFQPVKPKAADVSAQR
jgi:predicted pyridoxine 5'-phosphate oxidase superfamily flavin-nucleotide-binding protein